MPLFKSSKKSNKTAEMSKYPKQSYPTQPAAYPVQQQAAPMAGGPPGAPPAYAQYPQPQYAQQPPMYYPNQQPPQMYGGYNPGAQVMHQPQAYYQQHPQGPAAGPSTVIVKNGFDAGARFDGNTPASIPPPPPGCMANAAQVAQQQGHNVVVNQKKGNWMTDNGSDGGMVIW